MRGTSIPGKRHLPPIILALLLSLASCLGIRSPSTPPVVDTLAPTLAVPPAPVHPLATVTASLDEEAQRLKEILLSSCLEIQPTISLDKQFDQSLLVLQDFVPYMFDLNSGVKTKIQPSFPDEFTDYYVSPDGRWIAYQALYAEESMVTIEPVDSMVRNLESGKIQWKQDRAFGVQGWLSNDQLVITRRPADRDFESTLILNPFTQEEHEFFIEDYPNYKYYKSSGIGNYLFGHSNLMPDPTLTLMAYPEVNADGLFTTLWDLNTNRALAKVLGVIEDVYNDPLWSQAGNDFLIQAVGPTGGFEWYQVTREGYVRQLTQFNRFITEMGFADSSRSWDGRYLVFSLYYEYEGERGSKYIVLDLSLPNLDGFCIDNTMRSDVGVAQSPVWSPDSQYLIISDMITYNRGNLVLVDIKRRHAFHVTNDVEVRGWINNPESIR